MTVFSSRMLLFTGLAGIVLFSAYSAIHAATQAGAQAPAQSSAESRGWQLLLRNEKEEWSLRGRAVGAAAVALELGHASPAPYAQNSTGAKSISKAEVRVTHLAGLVSQVEPFTSQGTYWSAVVSTGLLDALGSDVSLYVWTLGSNVQDDGQASVYSLEKLKLQP